MATAAISSATAFNTSTPTATTAATVTTKTAGTTTASASREQQFVYQTLPTLDHNEAVLVNWAIPGAADRAQLGWHALVIALYR